MTTIITKNGSGAPLASDLTAGELAVDLTNNRVYSKNSGGSVVELGTNPTSLAVDTDTLYVDSVNNRVGIGTTTPQAELHIESGSPGIRLYDSGAGDYGRFTYNGGDLFIQADDSNAVAGSKIYFDVDGATVAEMIAGGDLTVVGDITSANSPNWDTAYNDKINSMSFSTSTGVLTLTQQDTSTLTVDLDGRFPTYQESTWSPVLADAAIGGTSFTLSGATGRYTKIADMVYCTLVCTITNFNGASGSEVYVRGLPFTSASVTQQVPIAQVTYCTAGGTSTYVGFSGEISASQTYMKLVIERLSSIPLNLQASQLVAGSTRIRANFFYKASA